MFNHVSTYCIQLGESTGLVPDLGCSRMLEHAKPDLIHTTTKFMVVVTSLFNLVISSFPDNMFYHAWSWTWLLIYHDGSSNRTTLFKTVRSSSHAQSVPTTWTSLSTTMFKLASSTMFKPSIRIPLIQWRNAPVSKVLLWSYGNATPPPGACWAYEC